MIYNITSFLTGWALAAMIAPPVVYPVLYGGPRAVVDAVRGRVRWWAPLVHLSFPMIAFLTLVTTGYLLAKYGIATRVLSYMRGAAFVFGEWTGIALVVGRMLTPNGRRQLRADYVNTTRPTDASGSAA